MTNSPTSCATPSQGTGNNGNVMGYFFIDPYLGHPNAFTYDSLNRLSTAQATGTNPANYDWTYTYDRWGNMQCSGSTGGQDTCPSMSYSATTNQLTAIGTQTPQYDAAGNLSQDGGTGVTGTHSYTWDAEGRLTSVASPPGTTIATYQYNALGQRVERSGSSVPHGGTLDDYYDASGNLAMVANAKNPVEDYIPAVAGRNYVKYQAGATFFMHTNPLGSVGLITSGANSNVQEELFYPWGYPMTQWEPWGALYSEQFASLNERDPESSLDTTPNRTYWWGYTRWMTPDPLASDITNHQSLNRYAYVMNSPMTNTDPLGLWCVFPAPGAAGCAAFGDWGYGSGPFSGGGGLPGGVDGTIILPYITAPGPLSGDCGGASVSGEDCPFPYGPEVNGVPSGLSLPGGGFGMPCDFGTCTVAPSPSDFLSGSQAAAWATWFTLLSPIRVGNAGWYALLPGTNYCGPNNRGWGMPALNPVDVVCKAHDETYLAAGISTLAVVHLQPLTPVQQREKAMADAQLCAGMVGILSNAPSGSVPADQIMNATIAAGVFCP